MSPRHKNRVVAGEELKRIEEEILRDETLPLRKNGRLVFGKGNPKADILFIGEAPGKKEAEQGVPFVGRAGKELDKLLRSISLTLADVYIANILKYRPPDNRDPKPDEIRKHTPYLVRQILTIRPRLICTLGNYSTKFVLAGFTQEGMREIAGVSHLHGSIREITVRGTAYTVIPLYHPAAMLYRPQLRQEMGEDFLRIGEFLGRQPAEQPTLERWV